MTRLEKIIMAVLVLVLIGTVIFWNDVQSALVNKQERIVDDEFKNDKKDKKDKKDKDADDRKKKSKKDEAYSPSLYQMSAIVNNLS